MPRAISHSHRATVQGAPWARLAQLPGQTLQCGYVAHRTRVVVERFDCVRIEFGNVDAPEAIVDRQVHREFYIVSVTFSPGMIAVFVERVTTHTWSLEA